MVGRKQGGAMRSVFGLLGLAALAVSLALLVGGNQALFTLFWPPYRFDMSFNFVLFCLVAGFVLAYLALRAIAMLRDLPRQAQRWREQQVERAAVAGVLDALRSSSDRGARGIGAIGSPAVCIFAKARADAGSGPFAAG
jgi:HemY protein